MSCKECKRTTGHKLDCGQRPANPFMTLDPAAIDVIDDMVAEWLDREHHGELNGGHGYGPRKTAALDRINAQIKEAWRAKVRYSDPENCE